MRILYFSRDYTTHEHRFLSALAKTKHQVGFLRLERRGKALDDRPLPPQVEQIPWAGGQSPVGFKDGLRLVVALKKVIRDFKPDLIHAGPLQRSALLVALTGFHPLVSVSWGYDLLMDAERNHWWRWATQFTLKHSDAFVGDCETIRDLAIAYGMAADHIITFPWGVDLQHFTPGPSSLRERLGWDDDSFVLISTRSWSPLYGVEDLARAFVRVARRRPEMRLLMLGNGPLAPKIRRIFMGAKMLDRVHFPGRVSRANLPDYHRAADLYISTSHSDGTSISLLEALACGTPVLLADIPGNREWVSPSPPGRGVRGEGKGARGEGREARDESDIGWLFRDGDVDALADGIIHAWEQREGLATMGMAGRHIAESRANWEKNFPALLEVYSIATKGV
ncbi:MAG: glycosyltransferase family 4 protein [Chloroflexota bacterium]|nr:glycosyltransferase family 4 protein [Chloroflexota bacterium]